MPILPNPQTQKWRAGLPGKFAGEILQTWNVDLEKNEGKVTIAERAAIMADGSDISGLNVPLHFLATDADSVKKWWALSTGKMAKSTNSDPTSTWAADALANSPTDAQDMVIHETNNSNQRLIVTRATDIAILNHAIGTTVASNNIWKSNWWSDTVGNSGLGQTTALSSSYPHPIERLDRLVAIGDGEFIHTIDQADVVAYKRLSFSSTYECIAIYPSLTRFWFVFQNKIGGKGMVAEWDGGAEKANVIYEVSGNPISGFVKDDTFYVITDNGYINKFNGRGFSPIAEFPNREEGTTIPSLASVKNCSVMGDTVNINIGSPLTSKKMRSGVWVFNTKTNNLYHRWGYSQYKVSVGTTKDYGQPFVASSGVGGIVQTFNSGIFPTNSGIFLMGAQIYSNYTSTQINGIYRNIGLVNRGYFITSLIASSEVEHFWYNLWIRFKKFISSNEWIVTKYRVSEGLLDSSNTVFYASATWVDTLTFTSVLPTGVKVGHEVEIMSGDNAGCSFHIAALSATPDGGTTITVTIDELAPRASTGGALVRFDDWVKIPYDTVTKTNPLYNGTPNATRTVNQLIGSPDVASGPYIQFKVELRGLACEVDQLHVDAKIQTGTPL